MLYQSTRPMRGATEHRAVERCCKAGFNPRAPCGARLCAVSSSFAFSEFQSTRPMRGATVDTSAFLQGHAVSIHAPHAGRDPSSTYPVDRASCFNPRAPCGARQRFLVLGYLILKFQSTRPMRGATRGCRCPLYRGGVSIHAPHAGRDGKRGHDFPLLPRIYGHSPPQIRFSRHLSPTPLLRHDSRTYIFTFCFLFTSPSHSVINAQMMMAVSKS